MRPLPRARTRFLTPCALLVSALLLTACGAGPAADSAGKASAEASIPTEDVVSGIAKDPASARLLPSGVTGLTLAISVGGSPPGTTYLDDGTTLTGQDVDFSEAVAKVLGVRLKTEQASFEAILPALDSGKYDVGASNFGVTDERRRTIDFVTYINDGQGFATRADSGLGKVTDLRQLCGLNVATGAGTTFEATLEENKHLCADAGKKAYRVQTYGEPGAIWSSLQQGRSDIVMSTINGLRYAVAQQSGVKFLNEFHRLDVGFAFKKGSALAPAFRSAVDKLIADGTYARILEKWGTSGSAIKKSEISPPELRN
ncbi:MULTISPECIES: ABC transporter substrate-binding protein [Streptomyces]|jgi:polar amino acid transport system substrate-binding protein|uniref:ABC transporter substrate-binding protein n=1 Tax=Streptomyces doudnae TaxID=3075536 RepID=A0ABD5EVE2_9ACTN|nr:MULTISPECIES: ABC transporter substrate-binding protein [unclassified Streptomyces]MDT0437589.1 ABC transporter substrate-binding protein [Streptomyces sp. DSM 41981]MYQ63629.1 transporter substrate-binding domain-containing protein [Streptomyces sp. SID4950]SCD62156.1 amino acid ABC transporter substrate-binding protein, PAAT family [Streptomyces sp. SolWspMP-5a-2]